MNDAVIKIRRQLPIQHWALPDVARVLTIGAALLMLALTGCSTTPVSHLPTSGPRAQVVDIAYSMLGAPYVYGGNAPGGFDCSGLAQFSYRQAGLTIPRTAIEQYQRSTPVPGNRLLPGDLLFFTLRSRRVAHVGIYVGAGKFIHAPAVGKRVMESRLDEPYWQEHLVRAGRLP